MMRFALCENEQEIINCISEKLEIYFPDEREIKTYADGEMLLSDCLQNCYDVIFLDINMPGSNGMEIAARIRKNNLRVKIILVSNQNDLAYKGYLYNAFRFLRKSNLEQEVCEAVKSLKETFSSQNEYLVFKTATGETIQTAKNIKYFEADGHTINMICNDKTIRVYGMLREFEKLMKNNGFIRIHKSYLVNFRYICLVEKNTVLLTCGKKLPMSRNRVGDAKIKMMFFSKILML